MSEPQPAGHRRRRLHRCQFRHALGRRSPPGRPRRRARRADLCRPRRRTWRRIRRPQAFPLRARGHPRRGPAGAPDGPEQTDTIVHFAAESHVDRSIDGPDAFIATNVVGTHALLKAARRRWLGDGAPVRAHRFHHVSTDEVYGSLAADDPPFTESTRYAPNSPYSASKAASDHLVRAYHHTYGLNTTISNCSNNYGPYHFPEKLIPLIIVNMLRRAAAAGLWRWPATSATGCTWPTTAAPSSWCCSGAGPARSTTSAAAPSAPTSIWCAACAGAADRLFAARADLRARYPQCPSARGEPAAAVPDPLRHRPARVTTGAMRSTPPRSRANWASCRRCGSTRDWRRRSSWFVATSRWWRPSVQPQSSSSR